MGRKRGSFYIEREELIVLVEAIKRQEQDSVEALRNAFTSYLDRYFHAKIPQHDVAEMEKWEMMH